MTDETEATPVELLRKGRADRRAARARMVGRALRIARLYGIRSNERFAWARQNADHLKMCSCWMCGNQRKYLGETFSERRRRESSESSGS
jgi:hypothetical protein